MMSKRLEDLGFNKVEVVQARPGVRSSEPLVTLTKSKPDGSLNKLYINGAAIGKLGWDCKTRVDLYWNKNSSQEVTFALKPAEVGCLNLRKNHSSKGLTINSLNACLEIHSRVHKEAFDAYVEDGVLFFK